MTSKHFSLSLCVALAACFASAGTMAQTVVPQTPVVRFSAGMAPVGCQQQKHQRHADECRQDRKARSKAHRRHQRIDAKEVLNLNQPEQPAFGWHYFSDPRAVHAVVISPVGEYFLSRGQGMHQVTGPAGSAL